MAEKRSVVVFDLGGVLAGTGAQEVFRRFEGSLGLPGNFFQDVIVNGGQDGPFSKAMLGQIGLLQLVSELDEDCKKAAATSGLPLPANFSVAQAFEEIAGQEILTSPLLQAALTLKTNGFKIAVLTNNWIDDCPQRHGTGRIFSLLRKYFDAVIESCRIGLQKPDPKIYEYTLEVLKAKPLEVIFLDDIGANLKPAREMGMATILVKDADSAVKELQDLTGIQLLGQEHLPPACEPEKVVHGYVTIKIPALADAGFRVLALEMKGYGDSTAPPDIKEYTQEEICKDLVVFLDKMGISQAVFIGHDWGGAAVWNMGLFYPERVRAVASLNTPFRPANPKVDVMDLIRSIPVFDYQLYFQEPGVAEAELEKNLSRTLTMMIRTTKKEDRLPGVSLDVSKVRERGGLLVGLPEIPPPSSLLPEPVLQYYIQQYKKSGFRGPLNWYRNMEPNWSWNASAQGRKIRVPALMVTAGKDRVLHPEMSKNMEEWIPQLSRGHIEECGHFTQMERPAALNKILIGWLEQVHKNASLQTSAKL